LSPIQEAFAGFPFPTDDVAGKPIPISGLSLWLDATWGVGLDGNSSRVAAWGNRVGSNAASQATTASMPVLVVSAQNGRNGIEFDGVDDQLVLSSPLVPSPLSIFVACSVTDLSATRGFLGAPGSATSFGYRQDTNGKLNLTRQNAVDYQSTAGPAAGTWAQVDVVWDGSTISHFLNGVANGTNALSTAATASISSVGRCINALIRGRIGEILYYGRALSPAERQQVQSYLISKWGIS
jgi:hypothetical protein